MRCRGSVARREPASTRNRSGRRAGELVRAHRAHARRRQLERERHAVEPDAELGDGAPVALVEGEVGLGRGGPGHEQLHRGDRGEVGQRLVGVARHRQRRHRPHQLGRDAERLPAGGEDLHLRAPLQHQVDQLAGGVDHVLAVVEHQEEAARREHVDDRVGERPLRPLLHLERSRNRGGDRALVAHRAELDPAHPVGERRRHGVRQPAGQAGLAHPTGAEQGEDATGREQPLDQLEVLVAADEGRRLRGQVATRRRRVGRRAPAPHLAPEREVLPLLQDRGLELAQVARRLEAEVVAQRGAEVLRHPQRLRLPTRPVEGEHQLPGELLPQRVLHRHRLEPADRFLVTADAQLGVDQRLHRHQPQLVEPDRLGPDPLLVGELGERVAPPLGQRGVEQLTGGHRVARQQALALGEAALEAAGVDQVVGHVEHVAGRAVDDGGAVVAQLHEPPDPRHVALERRRGRLRRLRPEHLDQPVGRDHRRPVGEQHGQETARHPASEREQGAPVDDPDGAEDTEVHTGSVPEPLANRWTSRVGVACQRAAGGRAQALVVRKTRAGMNPRSFKCRT